MTDTQRVILKMLKENTGSHFLDSGSAYGRRWERNQKRIFAKEPPVSLEVSAWKHTDQKTGEISERVELNPTISVFHFLSEAVEYDAHLDRALQAFARRKENEDTCWLEIAQAFAAKQWPDDRSVHTFNSYNGEDWLSQVIQGVMAGEDAGHVLLQIHGGCDVRGGYTRPRAFRFNLDWLPCLFDNARATIFCRNGHGWYVEPGYSQGHFNEAGIASFPAHVLGNAEKPILDKLCGRDDEAFCPLCGGMLQADF